MKFIMFNVLILIFCVFPTLSHQLNRAKSYNQLLRKSRLLQPFKKTNKNQVPKSQLLQFSHTFSLTKQSKTVSLVSKATIFSYQITKKKNPKVKTPFPFFSHTFSANRKSKKPKKLKIKNNLKNPCAKKAKLTNPRGLFWEVSWPC